MRRNSKSWALALAARHFGNSAAVSDSGAKGRDGTPLPASDDDRKRWADLAATIAKRKPAPFRDLAEWPAETPIGEYRRALAEHNEAYNAWRRERDRAVSLSYFYRYHVGVNRSIFFEVKGKGDTWEAALKAAGVPLVTIEK